MAAFGCLFLMGIQGGVEGQNILDRWNIHPRYTTNFSVNRTRQKWGQALGLKRDIGILSLSNRTGLTRTENSAQNNFEEQRASNKMTLDANWRDWVVGLDFNLRRDRSENSFSLRKDSDTNLGLRLESTLNVPLLDPVRFVGSGGYSLETDLRERRQGGSQNVRRDSTEASGTTWGVDFSTQGDLVKSVSYRGKAGFSGSNQTSKTSSFKGGDLLDTQEDPNDDFRRDLRFTVTWAPENQWKGELNASFGFNKSENFDFEVEQKEKRLGTSQNLRANVQGPIRENLELEAGFEHSVSDIDFEIKRQDSFKETDAFSTELRYEPGFFLLKNIDLRSEFDVKNTRKEPETSKSNDVEERQVKLVAQRELVKGLRVTATGEAYIRQEIYDDGSLDKDELRKTWDGSVNFSRGRRFSAQVSFRRTDTEIINIRAEQATNNNTVQRNRISAKYSYDFGFPVKVSQQFNISADYTFFTFDESSNTLRRTNEVRTNVETHFGPSSTVRFEHNYRFGDSGTFRQVDGGADLLYTPTSETLRQLLALNAEYVIHGIISLTARQSFDARTTTSLGTGRKRTTERVEFSGGIQFQHEFSRGFSIDGAFRQTQSNLEDDFWMVEASLNRDF